MALRVNIVQRRDRFSDNRSHFRCSWEWIVRPDGERCQERQDCCKNRSLWRVDPTFVRPNHNLLFPCLICIAPFRQVAPFVSGLIEWWPSQFGLKFAWPLFCQLVFFFTKSVLFPISVCSWTAPRHWSMLPRTWWMLSYWPSRLVMLLPLRSVFCLLSSCLWECYQGCITVKAY